MNIRGQDEKLAEICLRAEADKDAGVPSMIEERRRTRCWSHPLPLDVNRQINTKKQIQANKSFLNDEVKRILQNPVSFYI